MGLSAEQVASYRRDGYLLPRRQALAPARFAALKEIFEEHLAQAQARGERGDSGELDMPHARDPRLLEILLADELLDVVQPLIGPDIGLFASAFLSKEPRTGRATPWHEDSYFWEGRFDRMDRIATVWIALDRVDRENGCMKVLPGSHLANAAEYTFADPDEFSFDRVVVGGVDESRAVYFELPEGEFSLHDARIIHGADQNRSPRRRAGYTIRYFSQQLRFDPAHPRNAGHLLWHARGRNLAGNPVQNGAREGAVEKLS
jgi:ectoine hydroxylase-related dioxygenase (phytanoyl-CoA dioxygenase family)